MNRVPANIEIWLWFSHNIYIYVFRFSWNKKNLRFVSFFSYPLIFFNSIL